MVINKRCSPKLLEITELAMFSHIFPHLENQRYAISLWKSLSTENSSCSINQTAANMSTNCLQLISHFIADLNTDYGLRAREKDREKNSRDILTSLKWPLFLSQPTLKLLVAFYKAQDEISEYLICAKMIDCLLMKWFFNRTILQNHLTFT